MSDRPNILLIMADQMPAAAVGAYGHPVVRTPNIDRLAAEGVLFERCVCNSPLCVPSRASLVTGKLPGRIGSFDNGSELPAQVPTFMHHLRRAGYRATASGKMHFIGPDQLHGLDERLTTDIYPSGFNWTPDWTAGVVRNPGSSVEKLKDAGPCRWSMQLDYDEEVQCRSLERLRALADADEPFFLWTSFTHPHQPYTITQEYWDRYEHSAIDLPAAPAEPIDEMHPYNRWIQQHHSVDLFPPSDETVRNVRHAFYGMVSYVDDKVGELLAELERLGLADDTAVLFASDHGEMLGEHGMWSKRTFFDWSARVPLVVRWPGRWARGRRVGDTVSLVDLFPTLLDLAGPDDLDVATADADGRSLRPLLEGPDAEPRPAICEYYGEGALHPMRAVCLGRYKYVHVHTEPPLLFDLESDPLEQTDRAGRPEVAETEAELRDVALADWDPAAMEHDVIASQQARKLILEAQAKGKPVSWDHRPDFDPSQQYVRD